MAATLVGTVWQDLNADGQQTGGEPAVQYAVAELFSSANGVVGDSDDVSLGTRITDSAGNYQFTGLAAGVNHFVVVRPPVGFAFTTQDTGPDATDSDVSATGRSAMFAPVDLSTVDLDAGLTGAAPAFGWAAQTSQGRTTSGRRTAMDASGNSYALGSFQGGVDLDPGTGSAPLFSAGGADVFVTKFDAVGNLLWARRIGGAQDDIGGDLAIDASGNVLVTGLFLGTARFDPGAGVADLISGGNSDVFVLKLDPMGNLSWARRIGGTLDDIGSDVAADASGNILVTGHFSGTVDFDPGAGTFNLTSTGLKDAFVLKLTAAGNYVWARRVGGTSDEFGNGISVDSSGNVVVTGSFSGSADFDPGAGVANLLSLGSADAFVLKLDAAGNYVWARRVGGGYSDIGVGLAIDASGNVVVMGSFADTVDFDPGAGTVNLTSAGDRDVFVLKLSAAGNYVWARRVGGTYEDNGNDVAVDGSGNVLVTGSFRWTVDFDPGVGTLNLTSAGYTDLFVLKLTSVGDLAWAVRAGDYLYDQASGVAVDSAGNVLVTGSYMGTVDFDPGAGVVNRTSAEGTDAFLLRLDSSGVFLWVRTWEGSNAQMRRVAVDAQGNVYTTGSFTGVLDFDPGSGVYPVAAPFGASTDVFVAKHTAAGALVWARAVGGASDDLGRGVAVDAAGNVLLTGKFVGVVDFDPGAGVVNLTSAGLTDIFVLKLDAQGNFVWVRRVGDISLDEGYSLAIDAGGNVLVAGSFAGPVDFDPGPGTLNLTSAGYTDLFVLKLTSGGDLAWAVRAGGSDYDEAFGLAVDASGNVVLTGYFTGTADFDPGPGTAQLTSAASSADVFTLKLDSGGNYQWARSVGAAGYDVGYEVTVDSSGNIALTGEFTGTVDFDPGAALISLTSVSNSIDAFVLKLTAAGEYQWAKSFGGTGVDAGYGVAVNAAGSVVITGAYRGTIDFDPGPDAVLRSSWSDSSDVFAVQLTAEGNYQWVQKLGAQYSDAGSGVAVDPSGNVLLIGGATGTVDFDPNAGVLYLTGGSLQFGFITKLHAASYLPEFNLTGNGQSITAGDATPDRADQTDFGPTVVTGGTKDQWFTIQNQGTAALFLTGTPRIQIGGTHAADFTVTVLPSSAVNDGRSTALQITFDPSALGLRTATVTILNNDADEGSFTFAIQGTGVEPATLVGTVWRDQNGDGVQQGGEPGLPYAVVELFDTVDGVVGNVADVSLGTRVSGANGAYQFAGVPAGGSYYVVVRPPVGLAFTAQNVGSDATDSDVGPTGLSNLVAPVALSTVDLDAGLTGAAPGFGWAAGQGGTGYDEGRSVAVDAGGYSVVIGRLQGTVDFDPGPGTMNLTSAGNDDVFVAKYAPGGVLVWARRVGGTDTDSVLGITVDAAGNVFMTGAFTGTADFDPGAGVANLTSAGYHDAFVLKLDAAGNYVWARQIGGASSSGGIGVAVAVDATGNVLVTGRFDGTVDFDPGAGVANLTSAWLSDAFVLKLDAAGGYLWAARFGATSYETDGGVGVAVDAAGSVVVTGYFSGTTDFDPGVGVANLTSAGYHDAFVLKLDAAGNYQWAGRLGGIDSDYGYGVAVDGSGNVLVTGSFRWTIDFDPGAGVFNLTSVGSSDDAFVLKLDAGGNFVWAARVGGGSNDSGRGVAVDAAGNVLVTGSFALTADFDPGAGSLNLTSMGSSDAFVWKLTSGGLLAWAVQVGGTSGDLGNGVAVDASGNVYVTGYFWDTSDFDPGAGTFNLTSAGTSDCFVLQLGGATFDTPATVTGVFVRGTGDGSGTGNDEWQAGYVAHLGAVGLGDAALGYRVSVGADQLDTLPWTNVDTVSIRFSEGVTVVSGNLQVLGAAEGPAVPSVASFSYNASTFTATWQFTAPLPANKYLLHFANGAVVGLDALALDGEWIDGVSTTSGTGAAGGAFSFRLNVVPGDTNGDTVLTQSVTNADVLLTKQRFGTDTSDGVSYAFRRDVNGSGAITNADVLSVKQRLQTSIADFTDPVPPPPGESSGEESFAAARLTEPWHTETEPWDTAASSTDAALAEPVAPSSRLTEPWHTETSGPIDLAAWDAAILAIYGKKK